MRIHSSVQPAKLYEAADDLCVISAYFNPVRYESRLRNYEVFRQSLLAGGLRSSTVECAFGDDPFQLPPLPDVSRVRAKDVLWQKERLLNLALQDVPARFTKIAWIDCDVLFENPLWAVRTSELLERYAIVQPFDRPIRLMRDGSVWPGERWTHGFAAVWAVDRDAVRSGDRIRHGDTGLAWAARRDVLSRVGLYDRLISGGADHLMAHAMCGDLSSACVVRSIGARTPLCTDAESWGERFHAAVGGSIAHVPGAAFHLWHGDYAKRHYRERQQELLAFGFDPRADLRLDAQGCWEWASAKPEMHRCVRDYFARRDEDGSGESQPGG